MPLEDYKQHKRLDPEPSGEGGQGLNYNFRSSSDHAPNFIENGFAIEDVAGWAAYADAAGTTPVDGTGGAPTTTVTRTTTAPLIGDASILLTKPASNTQGEGISYDFSIDNAYATDQNRMVISLLYDTAAVTGVYGVYLYDVTGAALIDVETNDIITGDGYFQAKFIPTTSTSYRLIIHTQTTTATASTLKIDSVKVERDNPNHQIDSYGRVITTDNTETTILLIPIADDSVVTVEALIAARRTDAADRASYVRRASIYREAAGAATRQGSANSDWTEESDNTWNATIDTSGNNARIRVEGDAAQTVNWAARVKIVVIS
jgi:hypothetical protein